jgi:hypothetical protein
MAEQWLLGPCSTGVGSLPHRDTAAAVQFALASTTLPAIPTLPRRSPAEGMVPQALVGISGVSIGQYGSMAIEPAALDPLLPVSVRLEHDAFAGFRAFLETAPRDLPAVKWQVVGPVTLGIALLRAGVPPNTAFDVAVRAVREQVSVLLDHVADAFPHARQVVIVDEPSVADFHEHDFPIAPDTAIDLMSGALAAIETRAVSGLHCCAAVDVGVLLAAGPAIVSVPVRPELVAQASALGRFLLDGGTIAWGVVPTAGPIPHSAERPWRQLAEVWCGLVAAGVEPALLRTQSMVTPECGLGLHSPAVAERVFRITNEVARRVHDQASATRWVLGA